MMRSLPCGCMLCGTARLSGGPVRRVAESALGGWWMHDEMFDQFKDWLSDEELF